MTIPKAILSLPSRGGVDPVLFLHSIMICSHCDAEMPDISVFCPECGRTVKSNAESLRAINPGAAFFGAVAYITFLPAAVFLLIPRLRRDTFVRFHCWQSVFFAIATALAALAMRLLFALLSLLPGIGFLLACLSVGVVSIGFVVLWVVLVGKAALGQSYNLPWIGTQAARLAHSGRAEMG